MGEAVVTVELTVAELRRVVAAMHELIDAERQKGRDTPESDRVLLFKLAESF